MKIRYTLCFFVFLSQCHRDLPSSTQTNLPSWVIPPARTAIFPCQSFSQEYKEASQLFCEAFDKHILENFQDQPYMRGLSPQWVIAHLGNHASIPFQEEPFYEEKTFKQLGYKWLRDLGTITKTDSLLLPWVSLSEEQIFEAKILKTARRSAKIFLWLIEVQSGNFLWKGSQTALWSQQKSWNENSDPSFPPWKDGFPLLWTEILWRDYPGRQVDPMKNAWKISD